MLGLHRFVHYKKRFGRRKAESGWLVDGDWDERHESELTAEKMQQFSFQVAQLTNAQICAE